MSAIDSFQFLPDMQITMPSSLDAEHEAANSYQGPFPPMIELSRPSTRDGTTK